MASAVQERRQATADSPGRAGKEDPVTHHCCSYVTMRPNRREAIARALAAEGVAVAIHGRQPKRTYAVAADIEAHGGRVAVVLVVTLQSKVRHRTSRTARSSS